jgi:hypothetical protein
VKGDVEWRKYHQYNCDEAVEGMETNVVVGPAAGILGTGISLTGEHAWDWNGESSSDIAAQADVGGFDVNGQIGDHQIAVGGGWSTPAGGPTGHIYLGASLASSHEFLTTAGYFERVGETYFLETYARGERIIYRMQYLSLTEDMCIDMVHILSENAKLQARLGRGHEGLQVVP